VITAIIINGIYMDSTFLMRLSRDIKGIGGVNRATAVMGTEMNKTVLDEFGALDEKTQKAGPNDLVIALDIEDLGLCGKVTEFVREVMSKQNEPAVGEEGPRSYPSIEAACGAEKPNLAIISLPGEFAAEEGINALENGMHVFMFSDNVLLKDEMEMKRIGREKGLLVMGPGAGTAILDGISVGIMSKVRPGPVGIVAASGSGLQEVAMLVHRYGLGVTQAIGTGGRDLSKDVGGSTMLMGIRMLKEDPDVGVIVLISKPPHPDTMEKIFAEVKKCQKPVVIFFLGGDRETVKKSGAFYAATLEEAALMAVTIARGGKPAETDYVAECKAELEKMARAEKAKLRPGQKYLRGLFCGGTHSEEAVVLMQNFVPDLHSNIKFGRTEFLKNRHISLKNSLVDMGDEEFTKGRPHPVIDPSIMNDRLLQEGRDPAVGVILFDLLLGYAVHENPAGTIAETIRQIREESEAEGRYISMVASVCGTDLDPQGFDAQKRCLERLGVHVLESNGRAALLAGMIVSEGGKK